MQKAKILFFLMVICLGMEQPPMFDQSFSAENFRKIFDYENRKGKSLEREIFSDVEKIKHIMKEMKEKGQAIKELKQDKKTMKEVDYKAKMNELKEQKNELNEIKSELLEQEFENISTFIANNTFSLNMKKINIRGGKPAYSFDFSNNPTSYFIAKQIQYSLRKLYGVKQGNRYNIVCQLRQILSDPFPKLVIRSDIKNFYGSIPSKEILKKLDEDPLLSPISKKIIKCILHEYKKVSTESVGLPKGIGISAYLAELYMREFDSKIQSSDDLIYYARYVDDIILVYSYRDGPDKFKAEDKIKKKIEHEIGKHISALDLSLNKDKTIACIIKPEKKKTNFPLEYSGYELQFKDKDFEVSDSTEKKDKLPEISVSLTKGNKELEYLGYKFQFKSGELEVLFTDSKIQKYEDRIKLTFQQYKKFSKKNEKKARKILLKRIKFLTGNTRLFNNKGNVVTGIYFSNSLITCTSSLECLNKALENEINKNSELLGDKLKTKLSEFSFSKGFEQKIFHTFSASDLGNIVEVWKNVT